MSKDSTILNYLEDFGTCICDLTLGSCDANCCCDKDCSGITDSFKGGCLLEASPGNTSQIPYCSDQLVSVNVRNGIMVSVYKQGLNSATCVVVGNSASRGRFYGNPGNFITESAFLNKYALVDFPVESTTQSVENVLLKAQSYMVSLWF